MLWSVFQNSEVILVCWDHVCHKLFNDMVIYVVLLFFIFRLIWRSISKPKVTFSCVCSKTGLDHAVCRIYITSANGILWNNFIFIQNVQIVLASNLVSFQVQKLFLVQHFGCWHVKLTIHFHVVQNLQMHGAIAPLTHQSLWHSA